MAYIYPGTPRISYWSGGSKLYTYYLPAPDNKSGVGLEWIQKGEWPELIDGSESARVYGWIPELTLSWEAYNDLLPLYGYPIGTATNAQLLTGQANGTMLDFNTFMALLDCPVQCLEVSPSPSAGGLLPNKVDISSIGIIANGIAGGVKVKFRSGAIYQSKVLGAF